MKKIPLKCFFVAQLLQKINYATFLPTIQNALGNEDKLLGCVDFHTYLMLNMF